MLVVWWSATGGTEQLARAAADAAAGSDPGDAVVLLRCDLAGPEAVSSAGGYLFCTPENLASMAGMMKDFFDRCYYPVLDRIVARPYASIVCAGSDGTGATRQIDRIATGWRLRRVAEPMIVLTDAQTPEAILAPKRIDEVSLQAARDLGEAMAAGIGMGIW
ncbi:MAG: flavodoxin family protein [Burkholderiaceae bacterium]|nr:flavodoxin family protein [Burkholderiaceae bacterium]